MTEVSIALGTNLGDRMRQLLEASAFLRRLSASDLWLQSPVFSTAPVACPPGAPDFYNAVVVFDYAGSPEELLRECKYHERSAGRLLDSTSGQVNAPRVIDADILYFGALEVNQTDLVIPHPRMLQRRFVLHPLSTIRPNLVLPRSSDTLQRLLEKLDSQEPPLTHITDEW